MVLVGPRLVEDDFINMSIVIVGASMNVADHKWPWVANMPINLFSVDTSKALPSSWLVLVV